MAHDDAFVWAMSSLRRCKWCGVVKDIADANIAAVEGEPCEARNEGRKHRWARTHDWVEVQGDD